MMNCLKRFLHRHSHYVDLLSASLMICVCLIVLLPKVHESFIPKPDTNGTYETLAIISAPSLNFLVQSSTNQQGLGALITPNSTDISHGSNTIVVAPIADDHDHDHGHHHHSHQLPIGELIICIGFIVFYCLGLFIDSPKGALSSFGGRNNPSVCCSSTRCPASLPEAPSNQLPGSLPPIDSEETALLDRIQRQQGEQQPDDCLLLLNRHHTHHTHQTHHEHQHTPSGHNRKKSDYGTSAINKTYNSRAKKNRKTAQPTTVYIEEIRITRRPVGLDEENDDQGYLVWPRACQMTLFGLLLSAGLIFFDMNINGLMETVKVFRAAATGALLYIAFFLVMPRSSAGCNSCTIEEEQTQSS